MNIADFLSGFCHEGEEPDEEAFELAVDEAEGALRAGVRPTLGEYRSMNPALRSAFIIAGNRIASPEPDVLRDEVSKISDEIIAAMKGESA